ncbi:MULTISPECIES: NUDIX domain-containing protein [Henriciella]|jgi:8-oxo-dGTP pyrophosphatase MutT (NUDIX family)|uniref:DNA mismatch repair protein MutT n=1 Tax=Henriciella pelagia TaxID=1977912 RepID=A0ABQ1JWL3_9PROT|nr:NUDIX hydrolase [Henriciella pelagia]GGB76630.1 DNA mismatch repair protein MutT [Henriciella pelagia]
MADDSEPFERNGPWRVHSTDVSHENPWIRVETSKVTHPNGEPGIYGVVRFANYATGVLPVDDEGHTWLVGQHRFTFNAYSWELPEGGGAKGVDPLVSAARELEEEAGLRAAHWLALGKWDLSNSVSDERAFGYLAWGLSAGEAAPEPSEDLALERVPVSTLIERCLSGEITDSFTHLMVFTALERARRGELPAEIANLLLR